MSWTVVAQIGIAILGLAWALTRWAIRRRRRRADTSAIEPAQERAVAAPPPQIPPTSIVIVSPSQAPYQGGAVSTFPGPGGGTGMTALPTLGETSGDTIMPKPTFKLETKTSDGDTGETGEAA
jgi:hypothetical protein